MSPICRFSQGVAELPLRLKNRPGGSSMKAIRPALRAALYARVSSDHQAEQGTIASQLEALHRRAVADGVTIEDELCFVDDGFSGSTLLRPGLERLRDQAAAGAID